jgi:hypothetical protein
LCGY